MTVSENIHFDREMTRAGFVRKANRMARLAGMGAATVLLTACSATSVKERALHLLMERKATTLDPWEEKTIAGGDPLLATIEMSTALLVSPGEAFSVTSRTDEETLHFRIRFSGSSGGAGDDTRDIHIGSAVPVTKDGYFLTASHCLGAKDTSLVALVVLNGELEMVESRFRVVWRSLDEEQLDFAIIHAPLVPYRAFDLADPAVLGRNDGVAVAGWSGFAVGKPQAGKSAGRILSISPPLGQAPGPVWRRVRHNAPLHLGDSGGPLVDENGSVIGIHNIISFWGASAYLFPRSLIGYRGEAVAPDPEWLARVIAADRAAL